MPIADPLADAPVAPHADPGFLAWIADLVRRHRRQLVAQARGMGMDGDEALDCVQDAFCSFMERPEARTIARDADDSIKLLSVLLRHIVLNRRRKHGRRGSLLEQFGPRLEDQPSRSVDQILTDLEQLARVHGCILRMRALHRRVIELCLIEQRPGEDIAAELNISPGYARVLLHRAREHVRTCDLDQEEPVPWTA